jgi:hypothetical protein
MLTVLYNPVYSLLSEAEVAVHRICEVSTRYLIHRYTPISDVDVFLRTSELKTFILQT